MVRNEVLLDFLEQIKKIQPKEEDLNGIEHDFIKITISDNVIKNFLETNAYCTKCRTFKPNSEFCGLRSFCVSCKKETQLNYREKIKSVTVVCVCGKTVSKNSILKHQKTKFHLNHINKNS